MNRTNVHNSPHKSLLRGIHGVALGCTKSDEGSGVKNGKREREREVKTPPIPSGPSEMGFQTL